MGLDVMDADDVGPSAHGSHMRSKPAEEPIPWHTWGS